MNSVLTKSSLQTHGGDREGLYNLDGPKLVSVKSEPLAVLAARARVYRGVSGGIRKRLPARRDTARALHRHHDFEHFRSN